MQIADEAGLSGKVPGCSKAENQDVVGLRLSAGSVPPLDPRPLQPSKLKIGFQVSATLVNEHLFFKNVFFTFSNEI